MTSLVRTLENGAENTFYQLQTAIDQLIAE
jgi:hypothetical protein